MHDERTAQRMPLGGQVQSPSAEVRAGAPVGRCQRLRGRQERPDRDVVPGRGTSGKLNSDFDGQSAAGEHHVRGLAVERPADRWRTRAPHRFADEIVPKAELLSALSQDAGLEQLLDWGQQRGRGKTEHLSEFGDRKRSPQRPRDSGDLTRRVGHSGQAIPHARPDALRKPVGDQGRLPGIDADKLLLS